LCCGWGVGLRARVFGRWRAGCICGVGLTLARVEELDVGVEDSPLEVLDLFACVDFAEVAEVVQADEFVGGDAHGFDVEPSLCSASLFGNNGVCLLFDG